MKEAIAKAGYTDKVKIGMDTAASEFHKEGKYDLDFKNPNSDPSKWMTGAELTDLYKKFIADYPIVSIEDGFFGAIFLVTEKGVRIKVKER